jgi:RNA polymerase sigma-70 factor (ECF subfamily)
VTASCDDAFEPHRRFLVGIAYRMLGSIADAEDIVQDAYLRWRDVDRATIAEPRAYLARIASRLCLDRMKSAAVRREAYVGTWLPDPVEAAPAQTLADDLSVALLLALERLSPLERAAFLLHDVFDMDYAQVADTIERSEPACRQLAARARQHVRDGQPRYAPSADAARSLAEAFLQAAATGDLAALAHVLADDAVLYTDGGGKRRAALNPITGRDKILRFFEGATRKAEWALDAVRVVQTTLNGLPGFVFHTPGGTETLALEVVDGRIAALYSIRNPDKVAHLDTA